MPQRSPAEPLSFFGCTVRVFTWHAGACPSTFPIYQVPTTCCDVFSSSLWQTLLSIRHQWDNRSLNLSKSTYLSVVSFFPNHCDIHIRCSCLSYPGLTLICESVLELWGMVLVFPLPQWIPWSRDVFSQLLDEGFKAASSYMNLGLTWCFRVFMFLFFLMSHPTSFFGMHLSFSGFNIGILSGIAPESVNCVGSVAWRCATKWPSKTDQLWSNRFLKPSILWGWSFYCQNFDTFSNLNCSSAWNVQNCSKIRCFWFLDVSRRHRVEVPTITKSFRCAISIVAIRCFQRPLMQTSECQRNSSCRHGRPFGAKTQMASSTWLNICSSS